MSLYCRTHVASDGHAVLCDVQRCRPERQALLLGKLLAYTSRPQLDHNQPMLEDLTLCRMGMTVQ